MISCFHGSFRVTSPRGFRTLSGKEEFHGGLDLVGEGDQTVYAVCDATVDAVPFEENGFGRYVRTLLPDGRRLYYAHLLDGSQTVRAGDRVKAGDKLGVMGATGRVTGAHTHLELRPAGAGKESLDVAAFTGIPNAIGRYFYAPARIPPRFSDIEGRPCERAVEELCDFGIVRGVGDGTFLPDALLTREEAALLVRRTVRFITGK